MKSNSIRLTSLLGLILLFFVSNPTLAKDLSSHLDISQANNGISILHKAQILTNIDKNMNLEEALTSTNWLDNIENSNFKETLNLVWLKSKLTNNSEGEITRWLVINSPRIEDINFYLLDKQKNIINQAIAGSNITVAEHSIKSISNRIFVITLQPAQQADLIIKLNSRTEINFNAELWEPLTFREYESVQDFKVITVLLTSFALGFFILLSGLAKRDQVIISSSLLFVGYIVFEFTFNGYFQYFLSESSSNLAPEIPLLISLLLGFFTVYALRQVFKTKTYKITEYLTILSLVYFAVTILITLFGNLSFAINLASSGFPFVSIISLFILIVLINKRQEDTFFFLLFFITFYLIFNIRIISNFDVVDFLDFNINVEDLTWHIFISFLVLFLFTGLTHRLTANLKAQLKQQKYMQKVLEETVAQRTAELQQSLIETNEASRAKTDFLARVSHDFRSPLTIISGYAELIKHDKNPAAATKANIILKGAKNLLNLVDDLVDYTAGNEGVQKLQPKPMNLNTFVQNIIDGTKQLARPGSNQLRFEIADNLPEFISADEKRLHQILTNLLANACKFTREGLVIFKVEYQPAQGKNPENGELVFTIQDNGPGIQPDALKNIFEPFTRLKHTESVEGMGLGLAIAKQWADKMDAKLEIKNVQPHGVAASLSLPVKILSKEQQAAYELELLELSLAASSLQAAADKEQENDETEAVELDFELSEIKSILRPAEQEQLLEMLEVFAISQIMHWADELKQNRPEIEQFASYLWQKARNSDLDGLDLIRQQLD